MITTPTPQPRVIDMIGTLLQTPLIQNFILFFAVLALAIPILRIIIVSGVIHDLLYDDDEEDNEEDNEEVPLKKAWINFIIVKWKYFNLKRKYKHNKEDKL